MNDDTPLVTVLRTAMPPVADAAPSRDLWPLIANRRRAPEKWSWVDAGLAAAAGVALFVRLDWLVFLVYHL